MELSWSDAFLIAAIMAAILALDSLRRLITYRKPKPIVVIVTSIDDLKNNVPGKLYASLQVACPECGGPPKYVCGPSGQMSQNIFCSSCGQGYNVCELINFAEKIHKDKNYIADHDGRWADGDASVG